MFPVQANTFKSRENVDERFSESDSAKGDVESTRVGSGEETNFEPSEFESSFACVFVPSSSIENYAGSSCKPNFTLESMLRNNRESGDGQYAAIEHPKLKAVQESSSSYDSMLECHPLRRNKRRSTSQFSATQDNVENGRYRSRRHTPCKSSGTLWQDTDVKNIRPSRDSGDEFWGSKELDQDQILEKHRLSCKDKEGRRSAGSGYNFQTTNVMYVEEELKQKRLKGIQNIAKRKEVEIDMTNRDQMARGYAETFWTRMRNAFSMACWRGHTGDLNSDTHDSKMGTLQRGSISSETSFGSASHVTKSVKPHITPCSQRKDASKPQISPKSIEYDKSITKLTLDNQNCGSDESGSEDSKIYSSSGSSLSTENTTVVPACNIPDTTKPKITPCSSKEKFMAVKLVASLKRFFSTNPKTYDDESRILKNRGRTSNSNDGGTETEHNEDSIDSSEKCCSTNRSPSSYSSMDCSQSTDTSNYEVVNINSKHRQPM